MSVQNLTKFEFGPKLNEVLSASQPVKSIQHLIAREEELEIIERALFQTGRHIFIFGDRGVGKSSLAATAAVQYQSVDAAPISVSGSPDDTFNTIIANIATQALSRSKVESIKKTVNAGFEFRGIKFGGSQEISSIDIASQIHSIGDAVELLKQVATRHSEKPIVVIDEFDAILDPQERNKFAAFLKQLGDQSVNLKFIFTGIAKTLDDLLGAHQSAHRQLETIHLMRLSWEGRREIVSKAALAFDLSVNNDVNWRIAMVSDGFPYYVHLIAEKMLWAAYDDDCEVHELTFDHYYAGLRNAIQSINAELRKPYENAVIHRDAQYEWIVWATADGEDLDRQLKDMYASYKRIMEKADQKDAIFDQSKFNEHIRKLKLQGYGHILDQVTNRTGWYVYHEKMLRGYVRMQAEANGVELTGEKSAPKSIMRIGNQKTGSYGPSIPRGIRLKSER